MPLRARKKLTVALPHTLPNNISVYQYDIGDFAE
jgi:hypothetical protein